MSGIISPMQPLEILNPAYSVVTSVYEGPLDLLLQLIERAELDITKLALAQVTDQYLEYLHKMPENNVADVSSFLVIATKLIQIKSEALLPRPPSREPGEEDPGEALARQLILYKKFKNIASFLDHRQDHFQTYPRLTPVMLSEPATDLSGLSIDELVMAAEFIFGHQEPLISLGEVVVALKITIREKIIRIANYLRENPTGTFNQLLSQTPRRLDIVVTFLALLELIKLNRVRANQEGLFGEISLEFSEGWEDNLDFDLEFGE